MLGGERVYMLKAHMLKGYMLYQRLSRVVDIGVSYYMLEVIEFRVGVLDVARVRGYGLEFMFYMKYMIQGVRNYRCYGIYSFEVISVKGYIMLKFIWIKG